MALHSVGSARLWYYGITLEANNPSSLSYLLGIEDRLQLMAILEVCGLSRSRNGQYELIATMSNRTRYSWEQFMTEKGLTGYFDKFVVNKIDPKRRHWWISLGEYQETTAGKKYTPSSQFSYFQRPPRLPQKTRQLLRHLSKKMLLIVELYQGARSIDEDPETMISQSAHEEEGLSATDEPVVSPLTINASLLHSLVSDILSEAKHDGGSISSKLQEYTESLVKAVKVAQFEAQQNRMAEITGEAVLCLELDEEERTRKFPLLASFGIPFSRQFLSPILREIVQLSDMFPDENLLLYHTHRGTEVQLVNVPTSKNEYRFKRNLRRRRGEKSWLRKLVEWTCKTKDDHDNEEEHGTTGAGWVLESLGREFEDQFIATAQKLGYPVTSKKMPAESAAAMWQESNISKQAQRIILRHLGAHFGSRLVVPEAEVTALGQHHVPPQCESFVYRKQTVHYWTKPLRESLSCALEAHLESVGDDWTKLPKSIDVVVGGDHGKGRFRAVAKVILRDNDGKRCNSFVFKIGNIDCPKDTYEVLRDSIAKPLNEGLQSLKDAGSVQFYQVGEGTTSCKVCIGQTVLREQDATLMSSAPVRCLITGDLAFYTAVLGKVNMSGKWCIWCKLATSLWSERGHEAGELWNLPQLMETKEQIDEGLIRATDVLERKGVTHPLLLDSVEVDHYAISLLHIEIGVGNKLLNSYFSWVDYRVEEISEEEVVARREYFRAARDCDNQRMAWEEWMDEFGPQLADLRDQRRILSELMKMRHGDGHSFLHTVDERNQMRQDRKELTQQITEIGRSKKEQQSLLTTANGIRNLKTRIMKEKQKQTGRESNIRAKLEEVLVENGIQRSAYHGGDLTGAHVAKLFQNGATIFSRFQEVLSAADTPHGCDEREILDMNQRYKELCTLLDFMFSVARTPTGEATEEVCDLADEIVEKVMAKWRDLRLSMLPPKVHAIEDHLVSSMRKFNGIGCFVEDFIEQAHQFGQQDEHRTRGMPDRKRAAVSQSIWEVSSWKAGVTKVKEEVKRRTKRKRDVGRTSLMDERLRTRKAQRVADREQCLRNATTIPNPIDDYMERASRAYLESEGEDSSVG